MAKRDNRRRRDRSRGRGRMQVGEGPFPCLCGGKFSFGVDPPAVMHEPPVCSPFVELEPDRFLEHVRLERAKRTVS